MTTALPTVRDLVSIQCPACDTKIRLGDERCTSCGRPITGDERDALRRRWEAADPEAARLSNVAAYGRSTLLVVAGLAFIEGLIYGVLTNSIPAFAFAMVITAVMVGLFFLSLRRPLTGMIAGLTVYLSLHALAATVSLISLASGILFKVLIIGAFLGGIGAEVSRRKLEKGVAG